LPAPHQSLRSKSECIRSLRNTLLSSPCSTSCHSPPGKMWLTQFASTYSSELLWETTSVTTRTVDPLAGRNGRSSDILPSSATVDQLLPFIPYAAEIKKKEKKIQLFWITSEPHRAVCTHKRRLGAERATQKPPVTLRSQASRIHVMERLMRITLVR